MNRLNNKSFRGLLKGIKGIEEHLAFVGGSMKKVLISIIVFSFVLMILMMAIGSTPVYAGLWDFLGKQNVYAYGPEGIVLLVSRHEFKVSIRRDYEFDEEGVRVPEEERIEAYYKITNTFTFDFEITP